METPIYAVKDWNELYETHDTRKIKGPLKYVMMPNRWDGGGYRRVMSEPDGMALYAAWMVILQVASRLPKRGVLADADGFPITAEEISFKTGAPVEMLERAFRVLSDRKIGWLVEWKPSPENVEVKSNQISMFPGNLPESPANLSPNDDVNGNENGNDDDDRARGAPPVPSSSSAEEKPPGVRPEGPEAEPPPTEADVGRWMQQFALQVWGRDWGPPDRKIVRKTVAAANGAGLDGLYACLQGMMGAKGPPGRNYAWFPAAVENHLGGKHGA